MVALYHVDCIRSRSSCDQYYRLSRMQRRWIRVSWSVAWWRHVSVRVCPTLVRPGQRTSDDRVVPCRALLIAAINTTIRAGCTSTVYARDLPPTVEQEPAENLQTSTHITMSEPAGLLHLPEDLLLEIAAHLSVFDVLSLKQVRASLPLLVASSRSTHSFATSPFPSLPYVLRLAVPCTLLARPTTSGIASSSGSTSRLTFHPTLRSLPFRIMSYSRSCSRPSVSRPTGEDVHRV